MTVDELLMLDHGRTARPHARPFLVADLPFGSYEAIRRSGRSHTAQRFVKEAARDAVKLERGGTPRREPAPSSKPASPSWATSGSPRRRPPHWAATRPRASTADHGERDRARRLALQAAGCFAIVVEAVPAAVAELLVGALRSPPSASAPARDRRPGPRVARPARHPFGGTHVRR